LLINGGSFSKEDENIFQKSARVVPVIPQFQMEPREPIFEKCSHLRKKKGGADAFPRFVWWVVWAGCMVISGIATSKNHIELLVPGQI
jgi:hypothetical protein